MISSELDLLLNTCTVALNASLFSDLEDKDGILITHVMTAAGGFFTLVFVFCHMSRLSRFKGYPSVHETSGRITGMPVSGCSPFMWGSFSEVRQQYEEIIRKILHLGFCSETAFFFSLEKNLT